MTAQIPEGFEYRDEEWSIASIAGEGLWDPGNHEMQALGHCSACWRGFTCTYALEGEQLQLRQLLINLIPIDQAEPPFPTLGGVARAPSDGLFDSVYRDVGLPVAFSGGMLLARDFIDDLYVHMGVQSAWKYRRVHELIFDAGRLTSANDASKQIAQLREELVDRGAGWPEPEQIARCFSLDYRL